MRDHENTLPQNRTRAPAPAKLSPLDVIRERMHAGRNANRPRPIACACSERPAIM